MFQACIIDFESNCGYVLLLWNLYQTKFDKKNIGSKLIQETESKVRLIKNRLKATLNKQTLYVDLKQKNIEYIVGDKILDKLYRQSPNFGVAEKTVT